MERYDAQDDIIRNIIKPAIVITAYNRKHSLERLLSHLDKAKYDNDVTLIISIDYSIDNSDVIDTANNFEWKYGEKIVRTHEQNLGLKKHIMECGDFANEFGSIIFLEDDQIVSPFFYRYAVKCIEKYHNDKRIGGISLYSYSNNEYARAPFIPLLGDSDVYFGKIICTRGVVWTNWQWNEFSKWYRENGDDIPENLQIPKRVYGWKKSWSRGFIAYLNVRNRYFVLPRISYSSVYGELGANTQINHSGCQVNIQECEELPKMVEFEKGIKYDTFFENENLGKHLLEKYRDDVCVDIYGCNDRELPVTRFLLSPRVLDYKIIDSFGLQLRPHELNVYNNVSGRDLFLYDTSSRVKNKNFHINTRIRYDYPLIKTRELIFYDICAKLEQLNSNIRNVICKMRQKNKMKIK